MDETPSDKPPPTHQEFIRTQKEKVQDALDAISLRTPTFLLCAWIGDDGKVGVAKVSHDYGAELSMATHIQVIVQELARINLNMVKKGSEKPIPEF